MRFFCNVIIGKNRSHNDQFWSKCAPIWFIFFSPKPHPLNFNTFWPFTCECACFPHTTTFARWCLSCSGRFRMVTSSRESWAGEGRVSASSPPLPLHTSFSPWPNSPPAWRGKTHRAGWLILSRRYQSYGLAWSPRVPLEGIQFHHMCFKIRPLWFVGRNMRNVMERNTRIKIVGPSSRCFHLARIIAERSSTRDSTVAHHTGVNPLNQDVWWKHINHKPVLVSTEVGNASFLNPALWNMLLSLSLDTCRSKVDHAPW